MRITVSIKSPILWIITFVGCVTAAYVVARAELHRAGKREAVSVATERGSGTVRVDHPERREQLIRQNVRLAVPYVESGAWMGIPISWMEHCRLGLTRDEIHRMLRLDYPSSQRLVEAEQEAMKSARTLWIPDNADLVMSEGETLLLPALGDEAIIRLREDVVSVLPGNLSAAERELVGFLAEKRLREAYGVALDVTLVFSNAVTSQMMRHPSDRLTGFYYAVCPVGSDEVVHYPANNGQFGFLKVDPSVNNEGRNPLDRLKR